jgi:hypothetical protein
MNDKNVWLVVGIIFITLLIGLTYLIYQLLSILSGIIVITTIY